MVAFTCVLFLKEECDGCGGCELWGRLSDEDGSGN